MLTLRITTEDVASARYERYEHIVPKICKRMSVLSLVADGYSRQEVSRQTGVSTKSVKRYVQMYNESGLGGIRELRYRGPQSKAGAFRSGIEANFRDQPPRTSNEAAARIEELTGIKLSSGRALAFMKHIGMKCLKMGHIPAKADSDKQRGLHLFNKH